MTDVKFELTFKVRTEDDNWINGLALAAIGSTTCTMMERGYLHSLFVTVINAVPQEFAFNRADEPDAVISTIFGLLDSHVYPSMMVFTAFFTATVFANLLEDAKCTDSQHYSGSVFIINQQLQHRSGY